MVTSPQATGAQAPEEKCADNEDCIWTVEQVAELIKKVCSRESGVSLFATRKTVEPVGAIPPSAEKVILWTHRYLTKDERQALLMWGMAEGWRAQGRSSRQFMRDMSWDIDPSTIFRRRKRALKTIAACLSRDRVRRFGPERIGPIP